MQTFIFSVTGDPAGGSAELEPCPLSAVTEPMWAELAAQMACEPALLPYPAATLAGRAAEGHAAVAVWRGHIVGHVALVPLGCRAGSPGASHTWAGFCAAAGLSAARLPSLDVYDCAGSWTAPAWRGKGVSMALHLSLIGRRLGDHSLGLSGTSGMGSRRLRQLGWQIIGWSAAPFVSSLTGIPLAGFEDCAALAWQPPGRLPRYEGPPVDFDPASSRSRDYRDHGHPWSRFCYFWVSDPALAHELDGQLAALCGGDLYRWRRAVLEVFSQPGALHRPALLP